MFFCVVNHVHKFKLLMERMYIFRERRFINVSFRILLMAWNDSAFVIHFCYGKGRFRVRMIGLWQDSTRCITARSKHALSTRGAKFQTTITAKFFFDLPERDLVHIKSRNLGSTTQVAVFTTRVLVSSPEQPPLFSMALYVMF